MRLKSCRSHAREGNINVHTTYGPRVPKFCMYPSFLSLSVLRIIMYPLALKATLARDE